MGIDVCSSPNKEGQSLYFPRRKKEYFLLVQQQVQDKGKCLSSDFTWTFTFFQWTFFFLLTYDFLSLSHSPYYQSFMCISLIVSFWQMSFSTWQELFNKPIRSANLLSWILYFNRCFKSLFFQWTCVFFYQIPKPITLKLQVERKSHLDVSGHTKNLMTSQTLVREALILISNKNQFWETFFFFLAVCFCWASFPLIFSFFPLDSELSFKWSLSHLCSGSKSSPQCSPKFSVTSRL